MLFGHSTTEEFGVINRPRKERSRLGQVGVRPPRSIVRPVAMRLGDPRGLHLAQAFLRVGAPCVPGGRPLEKEERKRRNNSMRRRSRRTPRRGTGGGGRLRARHMQHGTGMYVPRSPVRRLLAGHMHHGAGFSPGRLRHFGESTRCPARKRHVVESPRLFVRTPVFRQIGSAECLFLHVVWQKQG